MLYDRICKERTYEASRLLIYQGKEKITLKEKANIIAVCNQKGGVGKTTTVVNLGVGLAKEGKRILLIDADPQGDLTTCLGCGDVDGLETTLTTVMQKIISEKELIKGEGIFHHKEGVDLMPSNLELSAMEMNLVNAMSREKTLGSYIRTVEKDYDYILIDCMPSLGMITINALTAADSVIIPVQAHYLPAKGMTQLLQTVNRVKRYLNPELKIGGVLLTLVNDRTNLAHEVHDIIREKYGGILKIYKAQIPVAIKAAEVSAKGQSIYEYDPKGTVAAAYKAFTKEVLRDGEKERHRAFSADVR